MARFSYLAVSTIALSLLTIAATPLSAQTRETATVINASAVLNEVMRIPAQGIPRSLLSRAQGIVIIPGMLKGGFVVGVRSGRGVAVVRNDNGSWAPPHFVRMSGGSIGYQIGVQSTDLILVFMTKKSVDGLLRGRFTIGADAAAAAGPVGREVAAATDERLKAEILSYSRSRGLFAGIAIDGSLLQLDYYAERNFYGPPTPGQPARIPNSAATLLQTVSRYCDLTAVPTAPGDATRTPNSGTATPEAIRQQLAGASTQLSMGLTDEWRRYLALPSEVYSSDKHPSVDNLKLTLGRYDKVALDPKYRAVAGRVEFQKTHALLREYLTVLTSTPSQPPQLPPPPKN